MLLATNINNTETKVGLFRGDSLEAHWRLTTTPTRTPDEWAQALTSYLTQAGRSTQEVRAAILASVVPPVTQTLCEAVERATTVKPLVVDGRSRLPITLDVEEPLSVGADRILNTLAAATLFRRDTIVVDFGTATTFDCITSEGRFLGGVIMPGLRTSADALIRNTAKLPATELVPTERVIGRRTEDCIRSGVLWGAAEAVDGLVRRIKAEWPNGNTPKVVATGGLAPLVAPLSKEIESQHPDLTLVGRRIAINSVFDRDEGDIGYLIAPPRLPRHLLPFSVALLAGGQLAALTLPPPFQIAYAICFALSILYSVPPFRFKAVAGVDWLINMWGFGTLTPFATWAATGRPLDLGHGLVLLAFCPLFAGLYPLTQLYQFDEDRRRGDRTLALIIGMRRSLDVAIGCILLAFALFGWAAVVLRVGGVPLLLPLAAWLWVVVPWRVGYQSWTAARHQQGMYRALAAWAVTDLVVLLVFAR